MCIVEEIVQQRNGFKVVVERWFSRMSQFFKCFLSLSQKDHFLLRPAKNVAAQTPREKERELPIY